MGGEKGREGIFCIYTRSSEHSAGDIGRVSRRWIALPALQRLFGSIEMVYIFMLLLFCHRNPSDLSTMRPLRGRDETR